jgi:hypothetical protein
MHVGSALEFVCVVCAPSNSVAIDRIQAFISSGVDWNESVETAYDHSLGPLFCSQLLQNHSAELPPDLRQAMQIHLNNHQLKASDLNAALLEIISNLENHNIAAIPFKGPTLSQRAFADPTLRLFLDLDILVQDADVDKSVAILIEMGYQHGAHFSAEHEAAVRRYGGQYHMHNPETDVCVEPHWALTPSTMAINLDYSLWWSQAAPQPFGDRLVLALAPEHETLMLCIHGSKEGWSSLKPAVDLAGFLDKHPQLDWNGLVCHARQYGCLRMLLLGLQMIRSLLDFSPPIFTLQLIAQDRKVQELAAERLMRLDERDFAEVNPYRVDRYSLAIRERWSDKLRLLLRTLLTPRAQHYAMVSLPSSMNWLYVPIKVVMDYMLLPIWRLTHK